MFMQVHLLTWFFVNNEVIKGLIRPLVKILFIIKLLTVSLQPSRVDTMVDTLAA